MCELIMSTGKHQDQTSHQLRLFGSDELPEVLTMLSTPLPAEPLARSELRLIFSSNGAVRTTTVSAQSELTVVAAKLVRRAALF